MKFVQWDGEWISHSRKAGTYRRAIFDSGGKRRFFNIHVGPDVPAEVLSKVEREIEQLDASGVDMKGMSDPGGVYGEISVEDRLVEILEAPPPSETV